MNDARERRARARARRQRASEWIRIQDGVEHHVKAGGRTGDNRCTGRQGRGWASRTDTP
jgi:hypothetical protein